jgi:hypothetical protein
MAGVVVLTAAAVGVVQWLKPPDAAGALRGIEVRGYSRIAEFGIADWAHRAAEETGVYIGPTVKGDLGSVITGVPLQELTPEPGAPSMDATDEIATGDLPDGCGLDVGRLRDGETPDSNWQVSAAQLADVRAGRLELLRLQVDCIGS